MFKILSCIGNSNLKLKQQLSKLTAMSARPSSFSTSSTPIRVIGVPEQVNIPIQLCVEHGIFEKHGVNVQYTEVKEGTGKMLQMLDDSTAGECIYLLYI